MQLDKKIYCHWDLCRFLSEEHLLEDDCLHTISVIDIIENNKVELMIFLGKDEQSSDYEVRIYKLRETDKYIKNKRDKSKRCEENDEYVRFFFEEFDLARDFLNMFSILHPEFKMRPLKKINSI